jgi:hypothetical protein
MTGQRAERTELGQSGAPTTARKLSAHTRRVGARNLRVGVPVSRSVISSELHRRVHRRRYGAVNVIRRAVRSAPGLELLRTGQQHPAPGHGHRSEAARGGTGGRWLRDLRPDNATAAAPGPTPWPSYQIRPSGDGWVDGNDAAQMHLGAAGRTVITALSARTMPDHRRRCDGRPGNCSICSRCPSAMEKPAGRDRFHRAKASASRARCAAMALASPTPKRRISVPGLPLH